LANLGHPSYAYTRPFLFGFALNQTTTARTMLPAV